MLCGEVDVLDLARGMVLDRRARVFRTISLSESSLSSLMLGGATGEGTFVSSSWSDILSCNLWDSRDIAVARGRAGQVRSGQVRDDLIAKRERVNRVGYTPYS